MSITATTITKDLKAQGLPIALYKGDGYFYFEWDSIELDGRFDTYSVMVNSINQLSREQWIMEAQTFAKRMRGDR